MDYTYSTNTTAQTTTISINGQIYASWDTYADLMTNNNVYTQTYQNTENYILLREKLRQFWNGGKQPLVPDDNIVVPEINADDLLNFLQD